MKGKKSYKNKLYVLVALAMCLCFVLGIGGTTVVGCKNAKKESVTRLSKLKENVQRKTANVVKNAMTEEECAFNLSKQMAEMSYNSDQSEYGGYISCEYNNQEIYSGGSTVFFHYYTGSLDDDNEMVYDEMLQLILDLENYLSKKEIATIWQMFTQNQDSVLVASGTYDDVTLIPDYIEVLQPAAKTDVLWNGKMTIINDEGIKKFTSVWKKEIENEKKGENTVDENAFVESESYFVSCDSLDKSAKAFGLNIWKNEADKTKIENEKNNVNVVSRIGKITNEDNRCQLVYSFVEKPLNRVIKQLRGVYVFLILFYGMTATVLFRMMRAMLVKQEHFTESQKMLTRAIAHELKTPLSIIQGYCQGLSIQKDEEKRQSYVDTITTEVKEMDHLVLDMLELSRLETYGYELEPEEIYLDELVNAVSRQYEKVYQEKNVNLIIDAQEDIVITGDLSCMRKVISNLVGNGIKHAKQGGVVKISIKKDNGKMRFVVFNDGPAIDEETKKTIWDGYHKVQQENKSSIRSTGLGLTIVKYMLELHGFSYGCDNCTSGVEFWFEAGC